MGYDKSRLSQCLVLLRAGGLLAIFQIQSHSLPLFNQYLSGYTTTSLCPSWLGSCFWISDCSSLICDSLNSIWFENSLDFILSGQ